MIALITVLKKDRADAEIINLALEALTNITTPAITVGLLELVVVTIGRP